MVGGEDESISERFFQRDFKEQRTVFIRFFHLPAGCGIFFGYSVSRRRYEDFSGCLLRSDKLHGSAGAGNARPYRCGYGRYRKGERRSTGNRRAYVRSIT